MKTASTLLDAAQDAYPADSLIDAAHAYADDLRAEDRPEHAAALEDLVSLAVKPDDGERTRELAAELKALQAQIHENRRRVHEVKGERETLRLQLKVQNVRRSRAETDQRAAQRRAKRADKVAAEQESDAAEKRAERDRVYKLFPTLAKKYGLRRWE